jgi:thiol-disulfide isomerase/thioredoxin
MGKASRTKVDSSRREKIAAQRAAARRAEQRRRILIAGGSILAVIIVIVAFIVIKANSNPSKPTTTTSSANGPTGSALASVVAKVKSVPASTLNSVGEGGGAVSATPQTIKGGTALTSGGKPEMLYMGAEYCPYCAAERWSMIVALSRFGTFSGLATVHSGIKNGAGEAEPYPSTPTWTFANAKYTSKYLTFTSVEMQTNIPDSSNGSYTTLQTPTAAQNTLIDKLDAAPYTTEAGAIPFVDFGNKDLIIGASYNPQVLSGLSWSTIATDLSNPSSPVAQAVDGTANYITAAICKMTGNQPASACTSVVQSLESKI